jgi:Pyruvate/2-oxoacid:ferredoxin oxidoreductase delta subunit
LDISLADFSHGRTVSFPDGGLVKQFTVASGVLAADGMVSLPKFKTHGLTRLTGAVKNQLGCVPGFLKGEFHARMPDVTSFCQMLVDLNRLLRPRLYVMDGIVAMEGNGPRNGDPRPMSVLLFSPDPIAVDAAACRMMNLDRALVPTITWGEAWGLGAHSQAEILGDPLESFIAPDFRVNRRPIPAMDPPGFVSSLVKNRIVPRPVIKPANCTRCGICVQVCPVSPKGIGFANGKDAPPSYDYDRCIRCYCCQEMCPSDSIEIRTPLLGRIIHR